MRKISGILSVIVTILLVMVFFRYLPFASRVEDLTESGAGLELGEWQVSVGIFLTVAFLALSVNFSQMASG
jgi:multisubunit Na+/H+ antiporter MnhB subunit